MRSRLPPVTYPPTILVWLASWILPAWREWFLAQPGWVEWFSTRLPMNAIFWGSMGLLAGYFFQDWFNKRSWLWENIRAWTQVFEISGQVTRQNEPLRFDVAPPSCRLGLSCRRRR